MADTAVASSIPIQTISSPTDQSSSSSSVNPLALAAAAAIEATAAAASASASTVTDPLSLSEQSELNRELNESTKKSNLLPTVTVPRLDDLILKHIADNYSEFPCIDELPIEYIPHIIALIDPKKLKFNLACYYIESEAYWERLARLDSNSNNNQLLDITLHGNSWKQLYLETVIERLIENYSTNTNNTVNNNNEEELLLDINAAAPYIHTLNIRQFPSHSVNLGLFLHNCMNLSALTIRYGAVKLGMDYSTELFGCNSIDAQTLAELIQHNRSLHTLILSENLLIDSTVSTIIHTGLMKNNTITALNLSHNKLTDTAVVDIVEYLNQSHSVLIELNLSDNLISNNGGLALATVLTANRTIKSIDLSLNYLNDQCAAELFNSIIQNKSLKSINISSNQFTSVSLDLLCKLIQLNNTLKQLNISCNAFITNTNTAANNNDNTNNNNNKLQLSNSEKLLASINLSRKELYSVDYRLIGLSNSIELELKTIFANRLAAQSRIKRIAYQQAGWDKAL